MMSRYEARGKFALLERGVRVARGAAKNIQKGFRIHTEIEKDISPKNCFERKD